jgi:CheY-like chemotaxis protein
MTLGAEGYQLVFADNGDDAIRKASEVRPDLIVVDAVMPRRSGYDVAAAIRGDGKLAATPVLLLVPTSEPYDAARGQAAGVTDTIVKPFETKSFIEKVVRLAGAAGVATKAAATMPGPSAFSARPAAAASAAPLGGQPFAVPAFATPSTQRPAGQGFAEPPRPKPAAIADPFAPAATRTPTSIAAQFAPRAPAISAAPAAPAARTPAQRPAAVATPAPTSTSKQTLAASPPRDPFAPASPRPSFPAAALAAPTATKPAPSPTSAPLYPKPSPSAPAKPSAVARDPFAFAKSVAPLPTQSVSQTAVTAPAAPVFAAAPVTTALPAAAPPTRERSDTWGEMTPLPRSVDHEVASPAPFKHVPELTPTPISSARTRPMPAAPAPITAPKGLPPEPSPTPLSELDLWGESTAVESVAEPPVGQAALWDGRSDSASTGRGPSGPRAPSPAPFDDLWPEAEIGSAALVPEVAPSPTAAPAAVSAALVSSTTVEESFDFDVEPIEPDAVPDVVLAPAPVPAPTPASVPAPAPAAVFDEAMLDALAAKIVAKLSTTVVERVAWEVVPALAETVIREELHRVIRGKEN